MVGRYYRYLGLVSGTVVAARRDMCVCSKSKMDTHTRHIARTNVCTQQQSEKGITLSSRTEWWYGEATEMRGGEISKRCANTCVSLAG